MKNPIQPDLGDIYDCRFTMKTGLYDITTKHKCNTQIFNQETKFEAESIVVKTSTNGDFETILDLDEIGTHDVIVSHDGKSIGKFSQQVTEENVREYAGIDILEIRLAILETLERILEVLFGKQMVAFHWMFFGLFRNWNSCRNYHFSNLLL